MRRHGRAGEYDFRVSGLWPEQPEYNGNANDRAHRTGSTAISDIVTASINLTGGEGAVAFSLTVTLESDNEAPLTSTFDQSIAETGAVQDLTADFTSLFDLNNNLPTILVSSDRDVPEPGSLAILAAGVAGLGLFRRRRQKAG